MTTWRITWGDHVWREADLTVAHLNAICLVQGVDSWDQCNPLAGPGRALGVLSVLVAQAEGRAVDVVLGEIARRPAADLLEAIDVDDDDEEEPPPAGVPAQLPPKPPPRPPKQSKKLARTG